MFFNFGFGDTEEVIFEQYVGNALVNSQRLALPSVLLQQQFMQACQEAHNQSQPIKIRMYKFVPIFDNFENKTKNILNDITYQTWSE